MRKRKSTILVVGANNMESKTMQIPTKVLLHWKKYLLLGMLSLVGIAALMSFIGYRYAGQYYTSKYESKIKKINAIHDEQFEDVSKEQADVNQLKETFESIEHSFNRVNQFLKKRGLKPLKIDNADGNVSTTAGNYEKNALKMEQLLKSTPIGKPYDGRQTSSFGDRRNPFGGGSIEGHPGIDFAGRIGDPISVTANGVVVFAGPRGGYGNCVIVQHSNHLKTLYGHMSRVEVRPGQKITAGQTVGLLGSTGRSTGPHVHYEIMKNDIKVNPQDYLNL